MSITRSPILPGPATELSQLNHMTGDKPDLLLVGHGVRGACAELAHGRNERLAMDLRDQNLFNEVRWGYLKTDPSIEEIYQGLAADRVCILPMLMCDGYFAKQRIPERLGLTGPKTVTEGREICLARPLGLQPKLTDLTLAQLERECLLAGWQEAEAQVVVVGHGSRNGSASKEALLAHVDLLRQRSAFKSVDAALLEEAPGLPDILPHLEGPVLVSGFFASRGVHASQDIPEQIGGRADVRYAGAVGGEVGIASVVMDAAANALSTDISLTRRRKTRVA